MAKYDAIKDFLASKSVIVDLSMTELLNPIPGGLPESAYMWEALWSNDDPTHPQSKVVGRRWLCSTPGPEPARRALRCSLVPSSPAEQLVVSPRGIAPAACRPSALEGAERAEVGRVLRRGL
ncbi:hypothetical protein SAMN04488543_0551 [Friedmanniella luteola]|uniref:Uncharacterized protein n=1 Tax=Friedmanniella luteola TaxID=546871 RepID=A0A1H1M5H8_9ACTN|nr:hypothetical protein [Friedmanniella luteola]SDR82043.1 hypothetical protein SAMN04488543_0551 [Friedmanniella luteola]